MDDLTQDERFYLLLHKKIMNKKGSVLLIPHKSPGQNNPVRSKPSGIPTL